MLTKLRHYIDPPHVNGGKLAFIEANLKGLLFTLLVISPLVLLTGLLMDNPGFVWGVINNALHVLTMALGKADNS